MAKIVGPLDGVDTGWYRPLLLNLPEIKE